MDWLEGNCSYLERGANIMINLYVFFWLLSIMMFDLMFFFVAGWFLGEYLSCVGWFLGFIISGWLIHKLNCFIHFYDIADLGGGL